MKNKKCFKCKKEKSLSEFYMHTEMSDGHVNKCKECNKKDVRENYSINIVKKRAYDKYRNRTSLQRIFNHKYSGIKARCTTKHKKRGYTVYGMKYLSKDDWNKWCYKEDNFKIFIRLYNKWVQSGYERKLVPSIDRIDNKKSYSTDNIQWLTLTENCSKHLN